MELNSLLYAFLILLPILAYFWLNERKNYWLKRHVPTAMESLFFCGQTKNDNAFYREIYERYKSAGYAYIGCFYLLTPGLIVYDLDLIKRILISDFESFPDRGFYHNIRDDPLSTNLVRVHGEMWRRLRSKLTPTFTSGKMRYMFPTQVAIGERLVHTVRQLLQSGKRELEIRDLCARFTTDIIGSIAFGIECNSLAEPHTKFRFVAEKAVSSFRPILEHFASMYPKFFQSLHVTTKSKEIIDFYKSIVMETVSMREANNIRRNDFLDILIELSKTPVDEHGEPKLTLDEMIGQVFIFFIAGYDTSSNTITSCLFELSRHTEIQERVRAEVLETLRRFDNQMSYDCLKEMRYLEQVVQETLRFHTVAALLRRRVRKRYQIPNTETFLEAGTPVYIPAAAIHHDPEYYTEPEKFDPERFSTAEAQKRHPMAYLPFGTGPRNCIAERFAKMEILLAVASLLQHFKFSVSSKTPKSLQADPKVHIIAKIKELYLNVEEL